MGTSEESLCVISQQSRLRNWIGRSFETAYLGKSNERPPPLGKVSFEGPFDVSALRDLNTTQYILTYVVYLGRDVHCIWYHLTKYRVRPNHVRKSHEDAMGSSAVICIMKFDVQRPPT